MKNNNQDAILLDHIQSNAPAYFPDLMPVEISVQLRSKQERPSAVLYRFDVKDNARDHSIIVKVPTRNTLRSRKQHVLYEKPSLFQKADSQDMH